MRKFSLALAFALACASFAHAQCEPCAAANCQQCTPAGCDGCSVAACSASGVVAVTTSTPRALPRFAPVRRVVRVIRFGVRRLVCR